MSAPRPRAWARDALLVASIALLVLAAGLTAVGAIARGDASHLRSRAEPVARELRAKVAGYKTSAASLAAVRRDAHGLASSLRALVVAIRAQVDSANHAVTVVNHSGGLYNSGDAAGARTALDADGGTAVDDLDAKTRAVLDAVRRAQQDAAALAGSSRG